MLEQPVKGSEAWVGRIGRWLRTVLDWIVWVLRRPAVMFRWAFRKARRLHSRRRRWFFVMAVRRWACRASKRLSPWRWRKDMLAVDQKD